MNPTTTSTNRDERGREESDGEESEGWRQGAEGNEGSVKRKLMIVICMY